MNSTLYTKKILLFAAMFFFTTYVFGQAPNIEWQKSLGGTQHDVAKSIYYTYDEGYIIAGFTNSNDGDVIENKGSTDFWIVKLSKEGSLEWQKSLGGSEKDEANSIQQTTDGGYIVSGISQSNNGDVKGNHGKRDCWVVKLSSKGDIQWQKSLGGSDDDYGNSILQTSDGGYIVGGGSFSNDGDLSGNHGLRDYWIVKLDQTGNIQWQKYLGGRLSEDAVDIKQTKDDGYIVAVNELGLSASLIIKLDQIGNEQWRKSFRSTFFYGASSISQTVDGGFVVSGQIFNNVNDGDYSILKLDEWGNTQWQKSFGGSGLDISSSIQQTIDEGYIIAGTTNSNDGDVAGYHGGGGGRFDYWIVKLDKDGSIQWQKPLGGTESDEAFSIKQDASGSYIIVGSSSSNDGDVSGHNGNQFSSDFWIVKLPSPNSKDSDGDGIPDNIDCAPNDKTKWQSAMLYIDADNDGYDNGQRTVCYGETIPTGYKTSTLGKDCNDNNASIHPGATEICGNGIDENCDGKDDACVPTDSDGDGVPDNTDCAPNDKTKWQSAMLYIDADNDGYDNGQRTVCYGETIPSGYKSSTLGKDCNDGNASIHPGATEICGNGIDEDCDGKDAVCVPVNVYYSKASGDLHSVLSWGANPDGSGANPADFGAGKTFNLANRSGNYTMTGNWTVMGTLVNPSGSQLQINGYTLSLTTLTGTGTLTGSITSSLVIAGTGGGNFANINFSSGGGMLKSFTLNRSGSGGAATIGTALSVYDVLTITSGTLNAGAKLTLKSNATGTARVAPVTGTISGNVTVERYIPSRRAWRMMSAPVAGNQSINEAWQEGVTLSSANPNPYPGYGTIITKGTAANGFDQNLPGQTYSILSYNNATNTWTGVNNTKTNAINKTPYFLFVRGDRSVIGKGSKATTLRVTGPLKMGDQLTPVPASGFTAVANPFASPINFATITRTNVKNSFYVWDPKMGGTYGVGAYVNISYNGTGYDITPASVSPESQYIQGGQAFLVQSTGAAGSIVIKETDKSATPAQNVFREQSGISVQQSAIGNQQSAIGGEGLVFAPAKNAIGLRVNLQVADGSQRGVLDEVFASYSSNFSDEIDNMDALKADNVMENLAIIRKGQALMVDRRKLIQTSDTLQLNLSNTTASTYMFEFSPIELSGVESVTLADHYLKTNTGVSLSETSQVYFHITSDSRSSAVDRFSVIIVNRKGLTPQLAGKASIRAYPNPVISNGNINLQFDHIKAGTYRLELVNAAGQTVYRRMMHLQNGTYHQQLNIGQNLPSGVYQMKITGKDSQRVLKILRR